MKGIYNYFTNWKWVCAFARSTSCDEQRLHIWTTYLDIGCIQLHEKKKRKIFAIWHLRIMCCVRSFCRCDSLIESWGSWIAFRCFRFASDWSGSLTRWMRDMFQLHAVHFGVMSAFWLRRAIINEYINKNRRRVKRRAVLLMDRKLVFSMPCPHSAIREVKFPIEMLPCCDNLTTRARMCFIPLYL